MKRGANAAAGNRKQFNEKVRKNAKPSTKNTEDMRTRDTDLFLNANLWALRY